MLKSYFNATNVENVNFEQMMALNFNLQQAQLTARQGVAGGNIVMKKFSSQCSFNVQFYCQLQLEHNNI